MKNIFNVTTSNLHNNLIFILEIEIVARNYYTPFHIPYFYQLSVFPLSESSVCLVIF